MTIDPLVSYLKSASHNARSLSKLFVGAPLWSLTQSVVKLLTSSESESYKNTLLQKVLPKIIEHLLALPAHPVSKKKEDLSEQGQLLKDTLNLVTLLIDLKQKDSSEQLLIFLQSKLFPLDADENALVQNLSRLSVSWLPGGAKDAFSISTCMSLLPLPPSSSSSSSTSTLGVKESQLIFLLNVYRYHITFLLVSEDLFRFLSKVLLDAIESSSKRNIYYETIYRSLLTAASSSESYSNESNENDRLKNKCKIYAALLYARIRVDKLSPSLVDLVLSTGRSLLDASYPSLEEEFKQLILSEIVLHRVSLMPPLTASSPSLYNLMDLTVSFVSRPSFSVTYEKSCLDAFHNLIGQHAIHTPLFLIYCWLRKEDHTAPLPLLPKWKSLPRQITTDRALVDWFMRQIFHGCRSLCIKKLTSISLYESVLSLYAWAFHIKTSIPYGIFIDAIYTLCKSVSESGQSSSDAAFLENYVECVSTCIQLQTEPPSNDQLLKLCHTIILIVKTMEPASESNVAWIEKALRLWEPFVQLDSIRHIWLKLVDLYGQSCAKLSPCHASKWCHGLKLLLRLSIENVHDMELCVFSRYTERLLRWIQSDNGCLSDHLNTLFSTMDCHSNVFWFWIEKWLSSWSDVAIHAEPLRLLVSALLKQTGLTTYQREMIAYYALPLVSRVSEENKTFVQNELLASLCTHEPTWTTHCLFAIIRYYHALVNLLPQTPTCYLYTAYTASMSMLKRVEDGWQSELQSKCFELCLALGLLDLYIKWTDLLTHRKLPIRVERLKIAYETGRDIVETRSNSQDKNDTEQEALLEHLWLSLSTSSKTMSPPSLNPLQLDIELGYVHALLLAKTSTLRAFQAHKTCLSRKSSHGKKDGNVGGEWRGYIYTLRNLFRMIQLATTMGNYKLAFSYENQLCKSFANLDENAKDDYWRLESTRIKTLIRLKAKLLSVSDMETALNVPVPAWGVCELEWSLLKADICHRLGTKEAQVRMKSYLSERQAHDSAVQNESIQDMWTHVFKNRFQHYFQQTGNANVNVNSEQLLRFSPDELCLYLFSNESKLSRSLTPSSVMQQKMLQSRSDMLESMIDKEKWNLGPWTLRTLVDEYMLLKFNQSAQKNENDINWIDWFDIRLNVGYQRELALIQEPDMAEISSSLQKRILLNLPATTTLLALSLSNSTYHKSDYIQCVTVRHGKVKYCRHALHPGTIQDILEEWKALLVMNRSSTTTVHDAEGDSFQEPNLEAEVKARWWQTRMQIDDKVKLWCRRAQSGLMLDAILDSPVQPQSMNPFVTENQEKENLILLLDGSMNSLPFESLPLFRDYNVSRMPTFGTLHQALSMRHQTSRGNLGLVYVLNPTGDLSHTENLFKPKLLAHPEWKGSIGKNDTANIESLTSHVFQQDSIYLYFGHGTGELYLKPPSKDHRALCDSSSSSSSSSRSMLILMGCSSGALTLLGDFEPSSPPFSYFSGTGERLQGILVNLWDVTDRDIDRYSESLFSTIGLFDRIHSTPRPTIAHAVRACRQVCRLKWLVGSAPVFYGLPDTTI